MPEDNDMTLQKICVEVEPDCLAKYSKKTQRHFLFTVLIMP